MNARHSIGPQLYSVSVLFGTESSPVKSSKLLLALASTVILGFGPLQDPCPYFCLFETFVCLEMGPPFWQGEGSDYCWSLRLYWGVTLILAHSLTHSLTHCLSNGVDCHSVCLQSIHLSHSEIQVQSLVIQYFIPWHNTKFATKSGKTIYHNGAIKNYAWQHVK
jgi:hypothetical protein